MSRGKPPKRTTAEKPSSGDSSLSAHELVEWLKSPAAHEPASGFETSRRMVSIDPALLAQLLGARRTTS